MHYNVRLLDGRRSEILEGGRGEMLEGRTEAKESRTRPDVVTKATPYALLVLLSIIWGIAFVAIRRADFQLSFVNLTLLRWFIASAGFLVIAPFLAKPKVKFEKRDLPTLILVSFANVVGYHLSLNYAEKTVSSGLAGLLISLGPVFVVLLSAVTLKEKIGMKIVLALALALTGALVLSFGDLSTGSGLGGPELVVVSALCYSVFAVLGKPLVGKYGALSIAVWAGLIGTAMLLPLVSVSFLNQVAELSVVGWLSVVYLAILSTVIGYSLFYTLLSRGAVSRVSIQLYLVPIVSVVGGALLLSEQVTAFTVVGGAALLVSVGLATSGSRRSAISPAAVKEKKIEKENEK
jgi:drug/metabolite transporter (DMT)-like permease